MRVPRARRGQRYCLRLAAAIFAAERAWEVRTERGQSINELAERTMAPLISDQESTSVTLFEAAARYREEAEQLLAVQAAMSSLATGSPRWQELYRRAVQLAEAAYRQAIMLRDGIDRLLAGQAEDLDASALGAGPPGPLPGTPA